MLLRFDALWNTYSCRIRCEIQTLYDVRRTLRLHTFKLDQNIRVRAPSLYLPKYSIAYIICVYGKILIYYSRRIETLGYF